MNAQRCWFFELWARRPASRIRSSCAGIERRGRERRGPRRFVADRRPRRSRDGGSPARGAGGRHLAVAGSTRASDRNPPGSSSSVVEALGVGQAPAGTAAATAAASSGVNGPPRLRVEEPRDRGAVLGELVQPRVPAALDDERLGHRLGPGGAPRVPRASAPRSATGTTPSSVPWTSSTGPVDGPDRARRADRRARCGRAAAGRRGWSARRAARRPDAGIGSRARRNVWRVSR